MIGEALISENADVSVEKLNALWHTNLFKMEEADYKSLKKKTLGFSSTGFLCEFQSEESDSLELSARVAGEETYIYSSVLQELDISFAEMKMCTFKFDSKNSTTFNSHYFSQVQLPKVSSRLHSDISR